MEALRSKLPSKDRIRIAARELFATNGFHQTSMSELAAAADMSVGLIYRLFKSKDEIIEAIVRADADDRLAEVDEVRRQLQKGELTISQAFEKLFLRVIGNEDDALSFDILAEGFRNDQVAETFGYMCRVLRDYLREFACAANSDLDGEELEGATEMLLGCLFGLGHRSISMPSLSAERTAEFSARMVIAALKGM